MADRRQAKPLLVPPTKTDIQALTATRYAPLLLAVLVLAICLCLLNNFVAASTSSTQLLMIESDDCPYCRKFDREIADIYPKTKEGMLAPLVRHHLGDEIPKRYAALDITSNTITPTFILIENGKEVDRLVGYNSDEFFWYLLADLFNSLETQLETQ